MKGLEWVHISVLYINDPYGRSYLEAVNAECPKHGVYVDRSAGFKLGDDASIRASVTSPPPHLITPTKPNPAPHPPSGALSLYKDGGHFLRTPRTFYVCLPTAHVDLSGHLDRRVGGPPS